MKPGRELDALVAERVLGWTVYRGETPNHYDLLNDEYAQGFPPGEDIMGVPSEIQEYSTEIRFAWDVVEKFANYRMQKLRYNDHRLVDGKSHQCFFDANGNVAYGYTAPEAICKAALIAVMRASAIESNESTQPKAEAES